ncbi:hypothetical protein OROHE_009462 [Orobanche hederae]
MYLISNHHHHSNKAHHAHLIELDLESASSSQIGSLETAAEVIRVGIKKLEEAIHNIIMRRAAPRWLPFLPGVALPNRLALVGASDSVLKLLMLMFVVLHFYLCRGSYMVNWSPELQTAVSDLEVEYSEEPAALYHIKYHVAGGTRPDFLAIATTRPETLFGDTAITVNLEPRGGFKNVLVIGAGALSHCVDWTNRGSCILFGDAAGAMLLC